MDVGGALPKAEIWTWLDKIWRSLPAGREVGWVAPDQTSPQSADGSEKGRRAIRRQLAGPSGTTAVTPQELCPQSPLCSLAL